MIPDSFHAEELEYWLDELRQDIETVDLSIGFTEAINVINQGMYTNFELEVGPGGQAWPPHAPETIRRYGPHPLLVLSGAMIAAVTEVGATGNITRVEAREAETGIDAGIIPYAMAQNFGFQHIPARPYFYTVDDVDDRAAEAFFDWTFELIVNG